MRVLIVGDDIATAHNLGRALKPANIVVDHTTSSEEALALMRHYEYDVVLLALALPDITGWEVIRRMRSVRNDTPVVVLAPPTGPQVRVQALDLGADDFITRPCDKSELLARMQAVVRRRKGFSQATLTVGGVELHLGSREVRVDGQLIALTRREYAILQLLMLRRNAVQTKGTILDHLYNGIDEPDIKIVDVFVCKVRKKLAQAGATDLVETVWGRGYMIRDTPGISRHLAGESHRTSGAESAQACGFTEPVLQ